MTQRWNVHRGEQVLGPYTAAEIRESLRLGTMSPFDMVSRDGTTVQRLLVEVDAIFDGSTEPDAPAPPAPVNQPEASTTVPPQVPSTDAQPTVAPSPAMEPPLPASPTPPIDAPPPADTPRPRRPKGYFLENADGFVLGPLTSHEIIQKYFQKTIDDSLMVRKPGMEKRIPVADFVALYGDRKGKSPKSGLRRLGRSPKGTQLNRAPRSRQLILPALFVLAGMILITWILLREGSPSTTTGTSSTTTSDVVTHESDTADEQPLSPTKPLPTIDPSRYVEHARPNPSLAPSASPSPPPRVTKAAPKHRPAKRVTPRPQPTQRPSVYRAAPPPPRYSAPPAPRYTPTPAPRALPAQPPPPPRASAPVRIGRVSALTGHENQLVTIGPLTFNPIVLDNCKLKCLLPMSDSSGGTLVAIFFKAAFAPALKAARGPVTVTGTARNEGAWHLYLKK